MRVPRHFVVLSLIFVALLSRLIPHPPNCTAMNAVALYGASSISNIWVAFLLLIASMLLSDAVLGFHSTLAFVYVSFCLTILLGRLFDCKNSVTSRIFCSLLASTLFFIVTNFGVWATSSYYPMSWKGLVSCYLAAIPFFQNLVLGDLLYISLIFFVSARIQSYKPCISQKINLMSCIFLFYILFNLKYIF
jgi:hypothetical protein